MIRVGCIGVGYFSQFHLDGWQRIETVELVGVTDQNQDAARASGLPVFATLEAMISEGALDVLDVILPPAAHAEVLQKAMAMGVKTIVCQKPFCTSLEEARAVIKEAEAQGAQVIVHENFRFQPWFRKIKEAIDAGAIGQPLQATFRLRPGDGQGPEAYLGRQPYFQKMERFLIHETGVHYIDVFRYLFGDPTAIYADLRRVNPVIAGEDAGVVLFDHSAGVRAILDGNRCLDHGADNTRCTMGEGLFEGTQGTLSLTGDGAVHLRRFGQTELQTLLPPSETPNFGGDCTYHLQAHVAAALEGSAQLENLAQDYLQVMKIEAAIYQSAEEERKITLSSR